MDVSARLPPRRSSSPAQVTSSCHRRTLSYWPREFTEPPWKSGRTQGMASSGRRLGKWLPGCASFFTLSNQERPLGYLLLLGEFPFDRLDERFRLWRHTGPETPYDGTVSCDKKLFEVPLNRSGKLGIGALRGQVLVQITLVPAVDVYFLEHGEGHAITRAAESGNLVSRSRFLLPELIAREP